MVQREDSTDSDIEIELRETTYELIAGDTYLRRSGTCESCWPADVKLVLIRR